MNFNKLLGQDKVREILLKTAKNGQLPNSYLFSGPEGVGKWSAALGLTAYLNCQKPGESESCDTCPSCKQISKLQHPNLFIAIPTPPSKTEKEELGNYWAILEDKMAEPYSLITGQRQMSIPVATVRQIKQKLNQKAELTGTRVIIIDQMDRMLSSSADALLKLVEEPPPNTLIIITSSNLEKLLDTIVSRCRVISFPRLPDEIISSYLIEKEVAADKKAILLARLSQGSIGRALYLSDDDITQDREVARLIFKGIFVEPSIDLITEAGDLLPYRDRFRITRIISFWQSLFRDLILIKNDSDNDKLINIDNVAELERLAAKNIEVEHLLTIPAYLSEVISDIELNVDTQTAVAALLIEIQSRLNLRAK
ncbi:MAG: DNA polymerase III subunit delta' [candidate division Zixibacteria bacterium]